MTKPEPDSKKPQAAQLYDILIIGGGAAGLTAAVYSRRANKSTLCLEAVTYGGQIINTLRIENYPAAPHISGVDFAEKLYHQALDLGTEIKFEKVERIEDHGTYKLAITPENTYKAKALIIATGSHERPLGLENEENLIGRGISYCATCDGNFYKNKAIAIYGGGNTAMWDALYLSDLAKTVYIIHHRDAFRADPALVEKVRKKPNISFLLNKNIVQLITGVDGSLSALELASANSSEKSGNHGHKLPISAINDKNSQEILKVDGLFVAIGREPSNDFVKDLIKLDAQGYIESDESCRTSIEGIFVAGDGRKKPLRQLVTATADGALATTAAVQYVNSN